MRVLILSTAFSGLAQRLLGELQQLGHEIEQHYDLDEKTLRDQVERFCPEVILCPFLTQRIPDDICRNNLCLIVHPGIEGDRGPSSLDWAISEGSDEWGVTLLLADSEMDAGDIWGTQNFPLRKASKASVYKREVTCAAIQLIKKTLNDLELGLSSPRPLDYSSTRVKGYLRPYMKQADRFIDWTLESAEDIVGKINGADSRPGIRADVLGLDVSLFGASIEKTLKGKPGEILAIQNGSFCCATSDAAVWIKQLKSWDNSDILPIKLPASMVLQKLVSADYLQRIPVSANVEAARDVRIEIEGDIAYLYFDFYNGAMNTQQCMDLKSELINLKASPVKMIVFMGGEDFFSNGIHLNCIEASEDCAGESWKNINAIDDVVFEMMNTPNQITVAALRNNAGAGGAIMALACDEVIIREGVVLNPHYKTMGLHGSEYWTYLLPNRVGPEKAKEITEACQPMLAQEAFIIGLVDLMFEEDWGEYHKHLHEYCKYLGQKVDIDDFLRVKRSELVKNISSGRFDACRHAELAEMKYTFYDMNSDYHRKRHEFVYKITVDQKAAGSDVDGSESKAKKRVLQSVGVG